MLSPFVVPRVAVAGSPAARARRRRGVPPCCCSPHGAAAADPPLSLAEALRVAVANSPQLASQRAMVDAAREMAGPAGELPDPKLKLGVENVPTNGADGWSLTRDFMTMSKIGVMQEFPREEKRRLRSQRAENDAQRGDVAIEAARLAVQRETAAAWLARWFAADAERAIASQIGEAELAVAAADRGLPCRQGAAGRAHRRANAWSSSSRTARPRRRRSRGARASGSRGTSAPTRSARSATRPTSRGCRSTPRALDDVDAQPEIRLARAQEAIAATEADLARASKLPDWSAELTYAVRGSPYSNMVSLMVSIDLPWSPGTRQDREHAAKLKELDAARAMREDTRRMRVAEVGAMLAEWESARAQAKRISDEMLPLAAQRREAALAAYRGGSGTLAAVLDARRAELDARLALIAQEQAAAKAWAWLQFVLPVTEKS